MNARRGRNLSNDGSYYASGAAHSKAYVLNRPEIAAILRNRLDFRHIAIEGPLGAGKSRLAERLAVRLDAAPIQDGTENPFLADFYAGRPGAAFQAQLFSLLARHRQQKALQQPDLFNQSTISEYLFTKDKMYACLNLARPRHLSAVAIESAKSTAERTG